MKVMDAIIDGFWVGAFLWMILYLWVWSGIPSPYLIKDTLYAISGILDYWFYLNAFIGTIRFIKNRKALKKEKELEK